MANLKSKSARDKLTPRREPYWHQAAIGVFLGFRRLEVDGTWVGRRLRADAEGLKGSARYVTRSFGALPGFVEAQKALQAWDAGVDAGVTHQAVTVADAARAYVEHLRDQKGAPAAADAEGRFRRLVLDAPIGRVALDKLQATAVRAWLRAQIDEDGDADDERKSRDSANRNLATLKASLNFALRDRLVATDAGWRPVGKFAGVGRRRELFLGREDRRRLLDVAEPHLRAFMEGLLLTAARPGELAAAVVADVNTREGTIALAGKTGPRVVALSTVAAASMRTQVKGKLPRAPLFPDPHGRRWDRHTWKKAIGVAVAAAPELPRGIVAYTLRHCAISELVMAGVDSVLVANVAGTSVAMIAEHYAHLRHEDTRARLDAVQML